ncbi:MAG: thioredoxin domain-containing protein [Acidobacteriaceae bacterium]|nr:thioredoxin domain-containing protein [Acidobacteriaceae bacterium]
MQSSDGTAVSVAQAKSSRERRCNTLAGAASAYLRSAMRQPVEWMEWGELAFERAATEDKPILLDIGAVWCHWCHVMDRESYEDAATAQIINQHFVAVKVDRDERPDVDARYQSAVAAISGQGGWPLTVFLTPEGKPYFGGTYFPPQDGYGRPSFQRVLLTMAEVFASRRAEVDESAASVMRAIEHNESFSGRASNPGQELVEKMAVAALKSADLRYGGFGSQPKFPHSSALDLLLDLASRATSVPVKLAGVGEGTATLDEAAKLVVQLTLEKMAQGGICDQLAGGFHRYSVDEHWGVPHFEKMAYDNSELLKNYVHACQTFGNAESARVAREILRWMEEWLSDRERGGFYASQDADISLDDDGDYFTWTLEEASEVLTAEELAVAAAYYGIGVIGEMQHNTAKNVLHVKSGIDAVARSAGASVDETRRRLDAAKQKLYAARLKRPTPYIDRTIYVAWNAMCISAYILAGRVLDEPEARAFALKSLDRVLAAAWSKQNGLAHVVAYGESTDEEADSSATLRKDKQTALRNDKQRSVAGVLDDYIFLGHAALDAWEASGEMRYYEAATELMECALERFYDATGGGFFDTERPAEGERRLGALGTRRKPLQDAPTPAGNPMAAALLLRLHALSGREEFATRAQETLESFAGVAEQFGLYAATYALALQRSVLPPVQVCVVGDDATARVLESAALRRYAVNKCVVRLGRAQLAALPPELAATLPHLARIEGSFAVVCSGQSCQPPVRTVEEMLAALRRSS